MSERSAAAIVTKSRAHSATRRRMQHMTLARNVASLYQQKTFNFFDFIWSFNLLLRETVQRHPLHRRQVLFKDFWAKNELTKLQH